jgi:hypothetical protein
VENDTLAKINTFLAQRAQLVAWAQSRAVFVGAVKTRLALAVSLMRAVGDRSEDRLECQGALLGANDASTIKYVAASFLCTVMLCVWD